MNVFVLGKGLKNSPNEHHIIVTLTDILQQGTSYSSVSLGRKRTYKTFINLEVRPLSAVNCQHGVNRTKNAHSSGLSSNETSSRQTLTSGLAFKRF